MPVCNCQTCGKVVENTKHFEKFSSPQRLFRSVKVWLKDFSSSSSISYNNLLFIKIRKLFKVFYTIKNKMELTLILNIWEIGFIVNLFLISWLFLKGMHPIVGGFLCLILACLVFLFSHFLYKLKHFPFALWMLTLSRPYSCLFIVCPFSTAANLYISLANFSITFSRESFVEANFR